MCQAREANRSSAGVCARAAVVWTVRISRQCAIVTRVRRRAVVAIVCFMGCALAEGTAGAQERITIAADVLLYGDNTEFRNPFREGETFFGAAPRLSALFDFNEQATLQLGIFANQRFGSERSSELTRPIIALRLQSKASTFIFGTLDPPRVADPVGPDRSGPHGLLPAMQVETLAFERPYEAGFQWLVRSRRVRHDAWLSWQALNTPDHRERFNAGVNTNLQASRHITVPLQLHIVHHGGQQFAVGPVADSIAGAGGASLRWTRNSVGGDLEILGLVSRSVPDREAPDLSRTGRAFLARASAERSTWRGHILFWRARHFVKEEGDPNYQSLRRDGSHYRNVRDYAETGLTRLFQPAAGVRLEVSARLHRVEKDYGYSYRVVAVTTMRWIVKGGR